GERHIPLPESGSQDVVSAHVAKGPWGHGSKRGWVEPLFTQRAGGSAGLAASRRSRTGQQQIRALRTGSVAPETVGRIRRGAGDDIERRTGTDDDARTQGPVRGEDTRDIVREFRGLIHQSQVGDLPPVLHAVANVEVAIGGANVLAVALMNVVSAGI